jgi:hypothetical protein
LPTPSRCPASLMTGTRLATVIPETPEARRHRDHQTRTPPPLGGRTGHRTRQVRASRGPKLSRRDLRRRRQRRPRRCRLQFPPPAPMAGFLVVRNPHRAQRCDESEKTSHHRVTAFFTVDSRMKPRSAGRMSLSVNGARRRMRPRQPAGPRNSTHATAAPICRKWPTAAVAVSGHRPWKTSRYRSFLCKRRGQSACSIRDS